MILLGTSGWSYDDWIGPVYPEGLPKGSWLSFIAEQVDTLEVNVTYYRVPNERTVAGWVERTPDDFTFAVKAHQDLTHGRDAPDFGGFIAGIQPLVDGGKLACVLAQFPYSFHANEESRGYLARLSAGLADVPVVVEFRNRGWISEATFEHLQDLGLGFCCVDQPQFNNLIPPLARATSPVAYVRFHGRNYDKWWQHDHAWERYDYSYGKEELLEWVPRLKSLKSESEITLAYANNHYRGQSLDTVRQLRALLASEN
jgi:uncharacterized protein YecE (DUF72 family)